MAGLSEEPLMTHSAATADPVISVAGLWKIFGDRAD